MHRLARGSSGAVSPRAVNPRKSDHSTRFYSPSAIATKTIDTPKNMTIAPTRQG
jgi:hypothetical protein